MTAFALAQTVVLPLIGKLGENFGQMRVFVACVVLFGVAITVVAAQFVRSDPGETTK